MTLQESVRTCFAEYADFSGRAGRPEDGWLALFIFVMSPLLSTISSVANSLFWLAIFLPVLAAAIRRLHDTRRSGWWMLLSFIPVLGSIVLIVFLAKERKPEASPLEA